MPPSTTSGHVDDVDALARHALARHLDKKGVACLVDDVRMPLRFDERNAARVGA
jgi:hypothetical protein